MRGDASARYAGEHLCVRWELLHEEEETFDRFEWFVAGEPTADDVDLVQIRLGNEQFLTSCTAHEDIDGRIDALLGDAPVEHEFHVSGALELLENDLVRAAVRFDQ